MYKKGSNNILLDLLYWVFSSYVEKLGFKEPLDDVIELLTIHAIKKRYTIKFKDPGTGEYEISVYYCLS